jgi:hypothetical protein
MADVSVTFGATDEGLEKTLKALQSETDQLKLKMRTTEMSVTEAGAAMKKIAQNNDLEKKLRQVGDESQGASSKVKTLGTAAEDTGKKGEIGFGKIAAGATLAGAAAKVGTMAIDAAFAVAQKTVQSFGDALNMGGRLAELSDRTGVAVDQLLILERAFQNTGVGADSLGPILNKMQKAIVDAGDGSSKAADAFTKLGIPLSTLQSLSPDEQLRAIGKAIAGIPDPAERAAFSMEIFGKSGGALNQVFANFDGELKTAKAQLGSLPEVMKAGAAQFDKISDNLTVISGKFVEFAAGIIDKVKPALDALTTALTRIDAAKIGQELAGFFTGAGEGMKGFQAAVDAIDAGDMGTAFKIVGQAIQLQFKETANSVYTNMVAAFKTIGDFITEQFSSAGPLVALFQDFGKLISGYITEKLYNVMADFMHAIGKFGMADTFRYQAETSAKEVKTALDAIPIHAELTAEKAGESMGNIPQNFKENMAGIPPLFTDLEKHQQEIDRLTQSITKSQEDQTTAVSETTKEQAAAEQEARKYFDEYKKGQSKAAEDAVKSAKAEEEKQAKLEEVLRLKREENAAQLGINNAIAAGNFQEAEALKNAESLRKTIEDLKKTGFGESEATKMANEMARAAREAERVKNSLATKIGADIKKRQESEAVDPSGRLQKKAQEQIAAGQYKAAEATGRQLAARELETSVMGAGDVRDMRSAADTLKDYYGNKAPSMLSKQEQLELTRLAREEGVFKDFSKITDSTKKGLDRFADLGSETAKKMGDTTKGIKDGAKPQLTPADKEKQKKENSLDGMVKSILELIKKIEPKLPTAALV